MTTNMINTKDITIVKNKDGSYTVISDFDNLDNADYMVTITPVEYSLKKNTMDAKVHEIKKRKRNGGTFRRLKYPHSKKYIHLVRWACISLLENKMID